MSSPLKSSLTLFALSLALSGCASVPSVDAGKDTVSRTKRITLLALREPRVIETVNIGGAAGAFGAVGGLIQGVTNADHSKTFVAALADHKVSLKGPLQDTLIKALQKDGFEVVVDENQFPVKTADGKGDDFSALHTDSDAILAVWIAHEGYVSTAGSTHYEPWVVIKARLLDAKSKQDLYYKTFLVGWGMHIDNAVKIPADKKYRFSSFDDLMARLPEAIAGLIESGNLAATQVGADLSVKP